MIHLARPSWISSSALLRISFHGSALLSLCLTLTKLVQTSDHTPYRSPHEEQSQAKGGLVQLWLGRQPERGSSE